MVSLLHIFTIWFSFAGFTPSLNYRSSENATTSSHSQMLFAEVVDLAANLSDPHIDYRKSVAISSKINEETNHLVLQRGICGASSTLRKLYAAACLKSFSEITDG
jgi:hypothetical protein